MRQPRLQWPPQEDRLYDRTGTPRYDEAMVLTWREGVLWQGVGGPAQSSEGAPPDAYRSGAGFRVAFAHLIPGVHW